MATRLLMIFDGKFVRAILIGIYFWTWIRSSPHYYTDKTKTGFFLLEHYSSVNNINKINSHRYNTVIVYNELFCLHGFYTYRHNDIFFLNVLFFVTFLNCVLVFAYVTWYQCYEIRVLNNYDIKKNNIIFSYESSFCSYST